MYVELVLRKLFQLIEESWKVKIVSTYEEKSEENNSNYGDCTVTFMNIYGMIAILLNCRILNWIQIK